MSTFTVFKDDEQWVPVFKWFWSTPSDSRSHGPFPCRSLAWLAGWLGTR